MNVTITGKTIATAFGTIVLGMGSWLLLETVNHGNRLTSLETNATTNERQDREIEDLRATVQDLIVFTRVCEMKHEMEHADPSPVFPSAPGAAGPMIPRVEARPEVFLPEMDSAPLRGYETEQRALEGMLRDHGLEPTEKPTRGGTGQTP